MTSLPERVLILNTTAPDAAAKEGELNALLADGYAIAEQRELVPGTLWLRLTTGPVRAADTAGTLTGSAASTRPADAANHGDWRAPSRRRTLVLVLAVSLAKAAFIAAAYGEMIDGDGSSVGFTTEAFIGIAAALIWLRLPQGSAPASLYEAEAGNGRGDRNLWRVLLGTVLLQMALFAFGIAYMSSVSDPATTALSVLVVAGAFQAYHVWSVLRRPPLQGVAGA